MEGQEISVRKLSEVYFDNPTLRFDSEYYKKEYTAVINSILEKNCDKVVDLSGWVTQGPNPTFSENGKIPCLTGRNINNGTVNYSNPDFVDLSEYNSLKRFQLKIGDTLITLKGKGSIGKIGYVTDERPAIFSRDIGIIRPTTINSGYVNAFILSEYGKKVIARGETGGTGQSTLTTSYLKNIDIPRFSIESDIGNLIEQSEELLKKSMDTFLKARAVLNKELELGDLELSLEPVNIKSFKNSFSASGRFDAEYYQIKYENYLELIYSYKGGFEPLSTACKLKDKNYKPSEKIKYKYVELSNIDKSGNITGSTEEVGQNLPSRARRLINVNDVIISSIEGSLESCGLVTEEYNNAICSTGFYVINSSQINSETLLVLFKSEVMQNILKQNCSGTILTAINKNEFLNIPVPLINSSPQKQIAKLVRESFSLKKKSEDLLEVAKLAVEKAIEESEEIAFEFIKRETKD